jgi:hypothetical protein
LQVAQQQQQHLSSGQAATARQQRSMQLPHAVKDEEAEIDRITKEAGQSDIWGNEVVGNVVKVSVAMLSVAWCVQQFGLPSCSWSQHRNKVDWHAAYNVCTACTSKEPEV